MNCVPKPGEKSQVPSYIELRDMLAKSVMAVLAARKELDRGRHLAAEQYLRGYCDQACKLYYRATGKEKP